MMDDVKIVKMEFPDEKGGISLTARSPAFAAFANECVKMFKEDGGVNYVEWRMSAGDPGFGIFTVVIQREAGETPAQQNGRLREELRLANLQIREYQAAVRKCDDCCACLTFEERWKALDRGTDGPDKRKEEPQMECSSCHKMSSDVQPYCSECYMDV
jgi:hypothetical protein